MLALEQGREAAIRSVTFRAAGEEALRWVLGTAQAEGAALVSGLAPLAEPGGGVAATLLAPSYFDGIGSKPEEFAAVITRERAASLELVRLAGLVAR